MSAVNEVPDEAVEALARSKYERFDSHYSMPRGLSWAAYKADDPDGAEFYRNDAHDDLTAAAPALVADLQAEVERLRDWKAEAMEVMSGLQEVGKALGVGLGQQITARATVDTALDLRNERDAARAELERVREAVEPLLICDNYAPLLNCIIVRKTLPCLPCKVRAALARTGGEG